MAQQSETKHKVFPTITQSFLNQVRTRPDANIFHTKVGSEWIAQTWHEFYDNVRFISLGLMDLGMSSGETVTILSNTRLEWAQADMAIMAAKGTTVPIYASNTPEDCTYIFNHCGARFLFVEDNKQLEKILSIKNTLNNLVKIIVFNLTPTSQVAADKSIISLDALKEIGKRKAQENAEDLVARNLLEVKPSDVATICYTSGTTGMPKGVVLTYDAIASEVEDIEKVMGHFFSTNDVVLSFLPMSHIFGKVEAMAVHHFGWKVYYAESIEKVIQNLAEIKPTLLFAVPRIFEKAYIKIKATIDEGSATKQKIFAQAMIAGTNYWNKVWKDETPNIIDTILYRAAKKIVFDKIYKKFGGKLRLCIAGGAPLPRDIAEFMQIIGISILEGYGLTETTAAVTLNPVSRPKFGSIGKTLPEVNLRIAEDGEILIKSRKNLREYFKNPEATKEVFTDGWFHTGDIGIIDSEGYIRITDRKKDLIVTSAGKNIAPQKIENLAKSFKYINQIMIYGDKRNYLTALVVLDKEQTIKYAKDHGVLFSEYSELIKNPKILDMVQTMFDELNSKLASYETVKKFKLLPNEFTIETGELTPSLKIKRKFCSEKYRNDLDALYGGAAMN